MIIKDKKINININPERAYTITEQNINSQNSFIDSKQKTTKQKLQELINGEANATKKQQYINALNELEQQKSENVTAVDGEIVLFSNNENWQEDSSDKYNNIAIAQNSINSISNEIENSNIQSDGLISEEIASNIADKLVDALTNNNSNIDSLLGKQAFTFLKTELENTNNGESGNTNNGESGNKNPFDNENLMPFSTSVHLSSCKGLRRDYLEEMRKVKKETGDVYAEKYADGITKTTMKYLTTGVKCITTHTGGTVIAAVGNSTAINCTSGYSTCFNSIVSYYRKRNNEYLTVEKEARTVSNAFAAMYDSGTLQELVIGTYLQPGSPPTIMPLVTNNTSYKINTAFGKQVLYTTLLASYKLMEKVMKSSNVKGIYKSLEVGTKYEDTDDIIASAMASGLKAMIALSRVTTSTSYGSTGTGLLIPFGT